MARLPRVTFFKHGAHLRMPNVRPFRFVLAATGGVLAALALAFAGASPAQAAVIATGACDGAALTKPFAAWGDSHDYKLMPGGDFEGSLQDWSVKGATITGGGAQGSGRALLLSPGASVQSPSTCVNTSYPTFRMFAKNVKGLGTVVVSLVYRLPTGGNLVVPVGAVALAGRDWSPSMTMLTASTVTGVLSGGTAQMSVRLTALTGSVAVDRIFVDPRMR
jgi:hypothetical protein